MSTLPAYISNINTYTYTYTYTNIRNYRNVKEKLAQMGWHCITVWECGLKPDKRQETLQYIEYTLNDYYLKDHTPKPTHTPTTFTPNFEPLPLAAEEPENE